MAEQTATPLPHPTPRASVPDLPKISLRGSPIYSFRDPSARTLPESAALLPLEQALEQAVQQAMT